jgi:hypothetical protein
MPVKEAKEEERRKSRGIDRSGKEVGDKEEEKVEGKEKTEEVQDGRTESEFASRAQTRRKVK